MSEFVILNSHQWRKCHKETCCCAGNYVVLRGHSFVQEFNTEEEAENYIESLTTAYSGPEKIEPLQIKINFADMFGNDKYIADKLNEVIEKVNLIMEVMNKGVK